MHILPLLDEVEFDDRRPRAAPLLASALARVVCFTLKKGQSLRARDALRSAVYLLVLKGAGLFAGGDGAERQVEGTALMVVDPGEPYSVRALEDLVFVALVEGRTSERSGPERELTPATA